MLVRLACITPMFLLLACISPEEQTRQQAEVTAERAAWWSIQLADENQCRMQGFQRWSQSGVETLALRCRPRSVATRAAILGA
jgi:hypothetical protein